jgi:hypothetical protein
MLIDKIRRYRTTNFEMFLSDVVWYRPNSCKSNYVHTMYTVIGSVTRWVWEKNRPLKPGANPTFATTGSLALFKNIKFFFYLEKRSSLLFRRCSCKFKSRRICPWCTRTAKTDPLFLLPYKMLGKFLTVRPFFKKTEPFFRQQSYSKCLLLLL